MDQRTFMELQARHFARAGTPWFVREGANPPKKLPKAKLVKELDRPTVEHYWTGEPILVPANESLRRTKWPANGFVIYRGPSMFDGKPIVCLATGFVDASSNEKTGAMIQTWIMREDLDPQQAVWTGEDASICGDCVHKGEITQALDRPWVARRCEKSAMLPGLMFYDGGRQAKQKRFVPRSTGRSCYVVVSKAPLKKWKDYHRGLYPVVPLDEVAELFRGAFPVRIGSYGDPVAVPVDVWQQVLKYQVCWTGYTHQWELEEAQAYKGFLMASVDSPAELARAHALGWRTFRIGRKNEPLIAGVEVICPATPEGGFKVNCDSCNLCMGASKQAKSIVTAPHGTGARYHEERGDPSVHGPKRPKKQNPLLAIVGNPARGTVVTNMYSGENRSYPLPADAAVVQAARHDGLDLRPVLIGGFVAAGPWVAPSSANPSLDKLSSRLVTTPVSGTGANFYYMLLNTVHHALRDLAEQQNIPGAAKITRPQWIRLYSRTTLPGKRPEKVTYDTGLRALERFVARVREIDETLEPSRRILIHREDNLLVLDPRNAYDVVWATLGSPHPLGQARERELLDLERRRVSAEFGPPGDFASFEERKRRLARARAHAQVRERQRAVSEFYDTLDTIESEALEREDPRAGGRYADEVGPFLPMTEDDVRRAAQAIRDEGDELVVGFGKTKAQRRSEAGKKRAAEKKKASRARAKGRSGWLATQDARKKKVREEALRLERLVAESGRSGSVEERRANAGMFSRSGKSSPPRRRNRDSKWKKAPKTVTLTREQVLELVRRGEIEGYDEAVKMFRRFHGAQPPTGGVTFYLIPDGKKELSVSRVQVPLGRNPRTEYIVPEEDEGGWKSNKNGAWWVHDHPKDLNKAPLEVLDPVTGVPSKVGGIFLIDDWWYS